MSRKSRFNISNESDEKTTDILEDGKDVKDITIEDNIESIEKSETEKIAKDSSDEVTQGLLQIEEVIEPAEEPVVEEKKDIIGIVDGCDRLNVRKEPSKESDIVCVVDKLTELNIDSEKSTDEFFKVITLSGVEGYCMKKFIKIK